MVQRKVKTANTAFVQYENCVNSPKFNTGNIFAKIVQFPPNLPALLSSGTARGWEKNQFYFINLLSIFCWIQPQKEDASNDAKKLRTWL